MSASSLSTEALLEQIAKVTARRERIISGAYLAERRINRDTAVRYLELHGDTLAELYAERGSRGLE